MSDPSSRHAVRAEFERAAEGFAERTAGRFDGLDAVAFSRIGSGSTVLEVGAGTGNFLALFEGVASRRLAADLTPGMLDVARRRHPDLELVAADGARLPFPRASIDLVCSAQALHHIARPVPVIMEMRRVVAPDGRVLVVDQVAPERLEEARARNELDTIRDPTHAASRPPSAMRTIVQAAGLTIVDERIVESEGRLSQWMWAGEFPPERIAAVRRFIEVRGPETGMGFQPDGEDWTFRRSRMMILTIRT